MSPDNHRAPSRLAPIRPGPGYPKPSSLDMTTAGTRPSPSREYEADSYEIIDSVIEDEPQISQEPTNETSEYEREKGIHTPRATYSPQPESDTYARAVLPNESLEWETSSMPSNPNELSKKERYQLLIQTVHHYEDKWNLASIRMLRGDRMAAYLTPCKQRLDLKTALNRQQVMVISLDKHGNTDIKTPPRRSLWQRFIDWLRGG